jgi:hypothetical protein
VSKSTSAGKSNILDKKGTCPKCRGDVRSPHQNQNCDGGDHELWATQNSIIVTCAIKGCSAPRYHVSTLCPGSFLFRISCVYAITLMHFCNDVFCSWHALGFQ